MLWARLNNERTKYVWEHCCKGACQIVKLPVEQQPFPTTEVAEGTCTCECDRCSKTAKWTTEWYTRLEQFQLGKGHYPDCHKLDTACGCACTCGFDHSEDIFKGFQNAYFKPD